MESLCFALLTYKHNCDQLTVISIWISEVKKDWHQVREGLNTSYFESHG